MNYQLFFCAASFICGLLSSELLAWHHAAVLFTGFFALSVHIHKTSIFWAAGAFFLLGMWRGAAMPPFSPADAGPPFPCIMRAGVLTPPRQMDDLPCWHFTVSYRGRSMTVYSGFPPVTAEGDLCELSASYHPPRFADTRYHELRFQHMRAKSEGGTLSIKTPGHLEIIKKNGSPLLSMKQRARRSIEAIYPAALSGIMRTIFLGDRQSVPKKTRREFIKAGTAHLLAISGLHVGLAALFVYMVVLRLWALTGSVRPGMKAAKNTALCGSAACAFLYAALTGFSPSALRAAVAVVTASVLLLLNRKMRALDTAVVIVFMILFFQPEMLWSISLQLSASAVFGIIRWGIPPPRPRLVGRLKRTTYFKRMLRRFIVLPLRISAAALLSTLPVVLYHFGAAHPWGLAANIAACPLLSMVIIFGAPSVLLGFWSEAAAGCLVLPSQAAARALLLINHTVSGFPYNTIVVAPFPPLIPFLCVGLMFLPSRKKALAMVCITVALGAVLPFRPQVPAGQTVFSPLEGDAAFYRTGGKNILFLRNTQAWEIERILRAYTIRYIDYAVAQSPCEELTISFGRWITSPTVIEPAPGCTLTVGEDAGGALNAQVEEGGSVFSFP